MSTPDAETSIKLSPRFNGEGLIAAIVQDAESGQVLMLAWMNQAALQQTLSTAKATFYSRSHQKIWVKGESSGHFQEVVEVRIDCDQDAVLLRCRPQGPACHAGYQSCFYRAASGGDELKFVEQRVFDPQEVYKP